MRMIHVLCLWNADMHKGASKLRDPEAQSRIRAHASLRIALAPAAAYRRRTALSPCARVMLLPPVPYGTYPSAALAVHQHPGPRAVGWCVAKREPKQPKQAIFE